ncbi:MAG TPA: phosphodiester glycosidase family protein [Candidatus Polarisedimenticolia bacterium]|nr:phosphodiester glycosidase family protein [Candidatus Polarisedimenticolia bacterium]
MQRLTCPLLAAILLAAFGCGAGDEAASLPAAPAPPASTPPAPAPRAPGETKGTGAAKGAPATGAVDAAWERLEPGLEFAAFRSRLAAAGDRLIRVLRIDPTRYRLKLLNASSEAGGRPRTARDWAERNHLTAAINASMYQADMRSSVSLMLTRGHVNNPRLSKDKAVLAFDPLEAGLPPVQIIDRECQDFAALRDHYATLVQSIRMISCDGRNVWEPRQGAWSTAAIGIDKSGRILFIHARAPHTTHDLIEVLLELPIELKNAMYVEGGSEAQMFVQAGGRTLEFAGSLEDQDDTSPAHIIWPIPNAVGIERIR